MQVYDIPINPDRMETTRHGTPDFPLAVYHTVMNQNVLGFVDWHWHEEIQFCMVTLGEVRFSVGCHSFWLREGEGFFVNSGYLHMAKPEGRPDSTYLCVDVSPRLLAGFPGSLIEKKYVTPYLKETRLDCVNFRNDGSWQTEILNGIQQIYSWCEKKEFGYELECAALLGQIWLCLLRYCPQQAAADPHLHFQKNGELDTILRYIHAHYSEPLTVADIAAQIHVSASECCRRFRRMTGETIFSYLRSYRLSRAIDLLRDDTLSVSQIAYETGFCSTSYFIEVFKKRLNLTPLQYRKSQNTTKFP